MVSGSETMSSPERTTAGCCHNLPHANGEATMHYKGTVINLLHSEGGVTLPGSDSFDSF